MMKRIRQPMWRVCHLAAGLTALAMIVGVMAQPMASLAAGSPHVSQAASAHALVPEPIDPGGV